MSGYFIEHVECAGEIPALRIHYDESFGDGGGKKWMLCIVREAWSWRHVGGRFRCRVDLLGRELGDLPGGRAGGWVTARPSGRGESE